MAIVSPRPASSVPLVTLQQLDENPHGVFQHLRKSHRIVEYEGGGYIVLRHDDVTRLSGDIRLRATETAYPGAMGITQGPLFDMIDHGLLTANDDAHQRRRLTLSRAIATQTIAELKPHVLRSAEELIDAFYADGQAELIEQFAEQIPVRTLAGLLDVPRKDFSSFTHLVYEVGKFFSPAPTPEDVSSSQTALQELKVYIQTILHERRQSPKSFLSTFLAVADETTKLSAPEIIFQIVQFIIGGTESVRTAVAAQTSLLLQHRDQWEAVCQDPTLIPAAVTEALRFEPGIAGMVRVSTGKIEFDDAVIPSGQLVTLSTMSALRDENVYEHSSTFNIRRTDQLPLHAAFGGGAHRCIAEALARVELEACLAALTSRIPQLQQVERPLFKGHIFIRCPSAMRVSWKP